MGSNLGYLFKSFLLYLIVYIHFTRTLKEQLSLVVDVVMRSFYMCYWINQNLTAFFVLYLQNNGFSWRTYFGEIVWAVLVFYLFVVSVYRKSNKKAVYSYYLCIERTSRKLPIPFYFSVDPDHYILLKLTQILRLRSVQTNAIDRS